MDVIQKVKNYFDLVTNGPSVLVGRGLSKIGKVNPNVQEEGKWITAACWHNCGGRCLNKALVIDGVVVRQKTDDTHPDSADFPQQRGCPRGRSQRRQVLGVDRLKYPMKRKNWEPGGGKRELRGKDDWVRISWDEALDIVASEIRRVKEKYGNSAIFIPSGDEMQRVLGLYGGYAERWGQVSWGAWPGVYPFITGLKTPQGGDTEGNDRFRLRKAKLIILWGANPAVSSNGNPTYNYLQAKRAGAKFIVVDPLYTESARVLADQWIPCRPGTDTAMILGMIYHIVTNNLQDQKFLDTYCVGFDADHMPTGVDRKENFKDYILGTFDGQAKSPEWASKICGIDADTIKNFAIEYAHSKPASIITAGAPARINNGEHLPHAMLTLGFVTGNHGIPGAGVSPCMHLKATYAGPPLVMPGASGISKINNPLSKIKINNGEMWDAVITGKYTDLGEAKDINIQMILHGAASCLNQRSGTIRGIEAHQKVEFVLAQNYVLNTDARYSDVILPVATQWEVDGGFVPNSNREIVIYYSKVIEPLFESKTDMWIACEVGKRLGLDSALIEPISRKQAVFNQIAGARVINPSGDVYEELVTITEADIAELGVSGMPQVGRIAYQEFIEKGIYQVPRSPGDKFEYTTFEEFINNPECNKLQTVSGKFQIHSQELSDYIQKFGWSTKSPIPQYEPSTEGYEEGLKDGYTHQLITIHYPRRAHSTLDNVSVLREAFPQEFWINVDDASKYDIKNGDVVKIIGRKGTFIRPAYVTERIMPGVVAVGQGAWAEIDEKTGIDKAGSVNVLYGPVPTGQGHSGHNSCNVKIEKYNGKLLPDVQWPPRTML